MGPLNNIFSLVLGINLILIGLVALAAGIMSLARRDKSVKKRTSLVYIVAGTAAVFFGVILVRSS
jgi:hypothetical protein